MISIPKSRLSAAASGQERSLMMAFGARMESAQAGMTDFYRDQVSRFTFIRR